MAPRGGKSIRSKKCAVSGRPPKRPKGCHPGISIEPVTGPAPKYRQRTVVDPAPTPSTSATDKSSPVPTDQSTASLPRGSTPTQSTASRSSPPTGGSQQSSDVRHRSTAPADSIVWCREDQRAISAQASLNRRSSAGRPDGMLSVHALGSKSIQERMFEKERQTGKTPSALPILLELNKKKDKVTNEATGDVYNPNFEMAFTQYDAMFHERYGQDVDSLQQPWDKSLWYQTEPVKAGLGKGRVLGAGPSLVAEQMLSLPCPSNIAPGSIDEELRRKYETVEAKNKALEDKILEMELEMQMQKKTYMAEVVSVKGDLANLTNLMKAYMAGAVAAGQGSMCSIPSVGSTATGLLASMHPFTPPEPQVPTPQADPPHSSFPESQP